MGQKKHHHSSDNFGSNKGTCCRFRSAARKNTRFIQSGAAKPALRLRALETKAMQKADAAPMGQKKHHPCGVRTRSPATTRSHAKKKSGSAVRRNTCCLPSWFATQFSSKRPGDTISHSHSPMTGATIGIDTLRTPVHISDSSCSLCNSGTATSNLEGPRSCNGAQQQTMLENHGLTQNASNADNMAAESTRPSSIHRGQSAIATTHLPRPECA